MDASVLRKIVGDDEATVRELLAFFRETAQRQRAEMHAACAEDNARQAAAVAHKLRSSSRSIGAEALASICAMIESAGTAGDLVAVLELMAAFDVEWHQEETAIDIYLSIDDNC